MLSVAINGVYCVQDPKVKFRVPQDNLSLDIKRFEPLAIRDKVLGLVEDYKINELVYIYPIYSSRYTADELVLPEWATCIERYSFPSVLNVRRIVLGKNIKYIGDRALAYEPNLKDIKLNDTLEFICRDSFSNSGLIDIFIPDSVKNIGSSAFGHCKDLKHVRLPKYLEELCTCTFEGCSSLDNVGLPTTLRSMSMYTFSECTSLSEIVIPESCKEVLGFSFYGCVSLKRVLIKEGCITFGSEVFASCTGISTLVLPKSIVNAADDVFNEASKYSQTVYKKWQREKIFRDLRNIIKQK